jgi:hypothetical protein
MATDGLSVTSDGNATAGGVYQTNSSAPEVDGLASGVFPDHPKTGPWYTLAGMAMTPWEMQPLESVAEGETRHQTPSTITQKWDSDVIVSTGMTKGGSSEFGDSDLPNH